MSSFVRNYFILSVIVLLCAGCGVRGPLTVNPPPAKGLALNASAAPAGTTDLRANPSSAVLYGENGKQTPIQAPVMP